jgi:hypothetical protein
MNAACAHLHVVLWLLIDFCEVLKLPPSLCGSMVEDLEDLHRGSMQQASMAFNAWHASDGFSRVCCIQIHAGLIGIRCCPASSSFPGPLCRFRACVLSIGLQVELLW